MTNCAKKCPGCGMTFSPDPAICPLRVFDGWREDVEFADDPEGWKLLQARRESLAKGKPTT